MDYPVSDLDRIQTVQAGIDHEEVGIGLKRHGCECDDLDPLVSDIVDDCHKFQPGIHNELDELGSRWGGGITDVFGESNVAGAMASGNQSSAVWSASMTSVSLYILLPGVPFPFDSLGEPAHAPGSG